MDPEPKLKAGVDIAITYDTVRKAGYEPIIADYVQRVRNSDYTNLRRMIGAYPDQRELVMFHGTAPENVEGIRKNGLKAFEEIESVEPSLSVTPSPLVALWHVISNGPHDTLREAGKMSTHFAQDKPVLLVLRVPKDYLQNDPDSERPRFDPHSASVLGITGERNTRIHHFYWLLDQQTANWRVGKDVPVTGLGYPVDHIPTDFIYVKTANGEVPINEFDPILASMKS